MSWVRTFRALRRRRTRQGPSGSDRQVALLNLHGVDREGMEQVDRWFPEEREP